MRRRAFSRSFARAASLACTPAVMSHAGPAWAQAEAPQALARIKARGRMSFAIYHAMPPFHVEGKGIAVDLAQALAKEVGVAAALLPFHAGENMDDDLRNMVWRGHYLGYGPADVMLHVPVDRRLMDGNPRALLFAPYYRDPLMIARDKNLTPEFSSLDSLKGGKIAVCGLSLGGWLMVGVESGRYREQSITRFKDGAEAAHALLRGEVAAAVGNASELESVLGKEERFAIEPLPVPQARNSVPVGLAVKKENTDVAEALQGAVGRLVAAGTMKDIFTQGGVRWRSP